MTGQLFVVGTPIGNLNDMTFRAVDTLKKVSVIACENIAHTKTLLNHFEIQPKKLIQCSAANERNSAKGIIKILSEGYDVALVSDAGMPGISDPGSLLVHFVTQSGFVVIPIPGVSALTTLVSVAGLNADNIVFTGFLSKKEGKILKTFRMHGKKNTAFVIFVSCHRIKKFFETLKSFGFDADIVLGKELTKKYELIFRGSIDDCLLLFEEKEAKGEFSVIVKFLEELKEE